MQFALHAPSAKVPVARFQASDSAKQIRVGDKYWITDATSRRYKYTSKQAEIHLTQTLDDLPIIRLCRFGSIFSKIAPDLEENDEALSHATRAESVATAFQCRMQRSLHLTSPKQLKPMPHRG